MEASTECPILPPCKFLADCESCSREESCSWCVAREECILADDIDSLPGCFDSTTCPPAPAVNTTVFVGKLTVTNDGSFGGALEVGGSCSNKGCHDNYHYSLNIDEYNMEVNSAGPIILNAANSDAHNDKGADILLSSGDGRSIVGGHGGDIRLSAGSGAGGKFEEEVHVCLRLLFFDCII